VRRRGWSGSRSTSATRTDSARVVGRSLSQDPVGMAREEAGSGGGRGTGAARSPTRRPTALFVVLAVACVAVPAVFTTRIQAVFVVPKLGVLWGLLAVCICLAAFQALFAPQPPRLRPVWAVDAAVALFVGLTTLAWIFSSDGEQSLYGERLQHQGLLTTLLYVAWFYVARVAISDVGDLRRLLAFIAGGGAIIGGYALVQKAGLDPVWEGFLPGGRVFSSIGQSNALAAYLVLVLPLAVSFAFDARLVVKVISLVVSSAVLLAFVFTQSRGGYVGLLTAGIVVAVGWRDELRLRKTLVAFAAVAVMTVAALAAGGQFGRLVSASDASTQFHLDAWRVAAEIAKDHPVLGTGPETFPDVLPRYSHDVLPAERASELDAFRVESPHNVYLGIAAGSGLPALIAYLVAIAGFVMVALRMLRVATREVRLVVVAVLGAVAGHLLADAFMSPEVTSTWLAWILLGGSLGMILCEMGQCKTPAPQDERSRNA
jgi:O-antigen ligase